VPYLEFLRVLYVPENFIQFGFTRNSTNFFVSLAVTFELRLHTSLNVLHMKSRERLHIRAAEGEVGSMLLCRPALEEFTPLLRAELDRLMHRLRVKRVGVMLDVGVHSGAFLVSATTTF
jgi:hypothetical protein